MKTEVRRVIVLIVAVLAAMAMSGCGNSHPSDGTVSNALKAELPAQVSIEKLECDYTSNGPKSCAVKFRGVSRTHDPLFVEFKDSPTEAFPRLQNVQKDLFESQAAAIRFTGGGGNEFTDRLQNLLVRFRACCTTIIDQSVKAEQTIEFSGTAAASREFGEWRITNLLSTPAAETFGKARGAFSKDALVVGSKESEQKVEDLLHEAEALDALFDETVARIEREAIAQKDRARDLRKTKMQHFMDELRGARFEGIAENTSINPHQSGQVLLTFGNEAAVSAPNDSGDVTGTMPLTITLVGDAKHTRAFLATFDSDEDRLAERKFLALQNSDPPPAPWKAWPMDSGCNINFQLRGGKLEGKRQSLGWHVLSASRIP